MMSSIHKLPFLLSAFAAVLVGMASAGYGTDNQTVYLRMVIALVVFYIIGLYIRKTVEKIREEVEEREIRELDEKRLKEKLELEAMQAEAASKEQMSGMNINLTAEDSADDFEPLTVSRVIANKVNQ